MSQWFRMYAEVLDDPKVQRLSPELFRAWVNILCLTAKRDGVLPPPDEIAFALRTPQAKSSATLAALTSAGLLDQTDDGYQPHNWNGRQFKSDVSNERVKRHRQRQGNTACNVTPAVTVTPPEAETEAEAETEQSRADARAISVEEVSKPLAKAKDPDDEAAIALGTKALRLVGKHDDPTWSFGEVYAWRQVARENGLEDAKLERIVETEIRRMTAGKPVTARSLKYFTPAITEAIMLRIDKPLQRPPPEDLPPAEVPEEYRAAVDQLAKLIGPRAHTVAYSQGLGTWDERIAYIEREIEFEQRGAA